MTLDNQTQIEFEKVAKQFEDLVNRGEKKQALIYFNQLTESQREYIQKTEPYSWKLKSASIQF